MQTQNFPHNNYARILVSLLSGASGSITSSFTFFQNVFLLKLTVGKIRIIEAQ